MYGAGVSITDLDNVVSRIKGIPNAIERARAAQQALNEVRRADPELVTTRDDALVEEWSQDRSVRHRKKHLEKLTTVHTSVIDKALGRRRK